MTGGGSNNPAPGYYQADRDGEYSGYSASIVANKSIDWIRKVNHCAAYHSLFYSFTS